MIAFTFDSYNTFFKKVNNFFFNKKKSTKENKSKNTLFC